MSGPPLLQCTGCGLSRFNRLDFYAPKTKRVPTAEWITLAGSSARTKS
jgi:hypothetical protein